MSQRTSLIFTLLVLLFTTACSGKASLPTSPAASNSDVVATHVAATVRAVVPTSVAATVSAVEAARVLETTPTMDMGHHMAMPAEAASTPTPFPTFTPLPAQAELVNLPTGTPACTNLIEFVKNLTINDNTTLKMGAGFAKLWRVKNAGTCTWTMTYSLVYVAGEQMQGMASSPLVNEVAPGQTIDLRVNLVAPHEPGIYTGSWMLQDADGNRFGLTPDGSQTLNLTIQIKPEASASGHQH